MFISCLLTSRLHSTIANQLEQEHEYDKNSIKIAKQEKQILKQQYK